MNMGEIKYYAYDVILHHQCKNKIKRQIRRSNLEGALDKPLKAAVPADIGFQSFFLINLVPSSEETSF